MRVAIAPCVLVLAAVALSGCNTGAPQGVLPRTEVPPPPSLSPAATSRPSPARPPAAAQRPAVTVPSSLSTVPPPETRIEPVMTGSGVGAGFKF